MLATTQLQRIFIHQENGVEIRLTDPRRGICTRSGDDILLRHLPHIK